MQQTTNYNLNKPDGIDKVYVDVLNQNMDILDTAVYAVKIKAEEPVYYNEIYNTPSALPASDVYPWARANKKPIYNAAEVGTYSAEQIDDKDAYLQEQIDEISSGAYIGTPITEAQIKSLFVE